MTAERWLPIPGYEDLYDVSDLGRVRSWAKWGSQAQARPSTPRILKANPNDRGYVCVCLAREGVHRTTMVHVLVLLAFVGPPPPGQFARHAGTADQSNNTLANLAYGTQSENQLDSVRHGTHAQARKTECPRGHAYTPENTIRSRGTRPGRQCRTCRTSAAAS